MEARHLSAERRREILSLVMRDPKSVVSAGGSALNTAMALQWSLGDYAEDVKACGCLGAIGEDEAGKILENSLQRTNVTALFQKVKDVPTGQCAILVPESGDRCIVAVRGAYRHLNSKFVTDSKSKANRALQKAKIVYCTSFLVTTPPRYSAVMYMAQKTKDTDVLFALNLSSATLLANSAIRDRMLSLLPYADLVFANEAEALAFVSASKPTEYHASAPEVLDAVESIAKRLQPGSTLAVTRGSKSTIVASVKASPSSVRSPSSAIECGTRNSGSSKNLKYIEVTEHSVRKLSALEVLGPVVDTNGAGDAFVGGYLAALIAGHAMNSKSAVEAGHFAAGIAVRCTGSVWDALHDDNAVRKHVRPLLCPPEDSLKSK
mmetsp:Transcript_8309/g.11778  ORF Transcript_8309/g.11778 Transcript_8309/m.11778 type:complete len:377 (-) Transcript_8309:148-1278(-)